MKGLLLLLGIISTMVFTNQALSYSIQTKFETKNYAVFQVILGRSEVYGPNLKKIIAKDVAGRGKFQTTTAIYPEGSKGMDATIREKLLGIITTENYDRKPQVTVNFNDKVKYSSYVGIYMNFKQLSKISDNRSLSTLASELAQVPLVLEDVPISVVSKDFNGKTIYTASSGAMILDFMVVDSLYYDKKKLEEATDKCRVNLLVITDRYTDFSPFFMGAHGAVNDLICDTPKK